MNILYEDNCIIVVEKIAGIATQSAKVGETDLESELRKYRKAGGDKPEIYVIHRLDQPVSGILVFAKTKEAAAALSKDMQKDAFSKDYQALVLKPGNFVKEAKLVDYLIKDGKTNSSKIADISSQAGARRAELKYETIREDDKTALLRVHLMTGRHHQIRVQLSNAGMPILGDLKYGSKESISLSSEMNIKFVGLRAYRLTFKHPVSGKIMEFELNDNMEND